MKDREMTPMTLILGWMVYESRFAGFIHAIRHNTKTIVLIHIYIY